MKSIWIYPVFMLFAAGCAQQRAASGPATMTMAGAGKAEVMEAAKDVLADMSFALDKYDVDAGVITTAPLRGGQFFEFWRKDNADAFAAAESNIQSIRRTVAVEFAQSAAGTIVKCEAKTERLYIPASKMAGFAQTAGLFTDSDSSLQELELNKQQSQQVKWIELGQDGRLAEVLIDRIKSRLKQIKGNG